MRTSNPASPQGLKPAAATDRGQLLLAAQRKPKRGADLLHAYIAQNGEEVIGATVTVERWPNATSRVNTSARHCLSGFLKPAKMDSTTIQSSGQAAASSRAGVPLAAAVLLDSRADHVPPGRAYVNV
jgi:hypothetical protein